MRHVRLGQPEKSAMAEHKFEKDHNIELGNMTMLDKTANGITLHSRNFGRDGVSMVQGD
jgi:hypothetical protein